LFILLLYSIIFRDKYSRDRLVMKLTIKAVETINNSAQTQ